MKRKGERPESCRVGSTKQPRPWTEMLSYLQRIWDNLRRISQMESLESNPRDAIFPYRRVINPKSKLRDEE